MKMENTILNKKEQIPSTAQKMKFSIKDLKLQIWSYLRKKSLMENFISCAVKNSIGV